jgi:hypothetical protein
MLVYVGTDEGGNVHLTDNSCFHFFINDRYGLNSQSRKVGHPLLREPGLRISRHGVRLIIWYRVRAGVHGKSGLHRRGIHGRIESLEWELLLRRRILRVIDWRISVS